MYQVGEPKEILVDQMEWNENGRSGQQYSYHMSKERFERTNETNYQICIEKDGKEEKLCTFGYYDLIDFNYEDNLNDRMMEDVAKELGVAPEQVMEVITEPLKQLQKKVREEFETTEEAHAKREHEEIISKYKKAKNDFMMQYGFLAKDYDRCFNIFGELMDSEYYGILQQRLKEREDSKYQSKRYRKSESQKRFHEYLYTQTNVEYSEEERRTLAKFYKTLAKKYHPDANQNVDTSEEMTLLNKIKKQWGV